MELRAGPMTCLSLSGTGWLPMTGENSLRHEAVIEYEL